MGAPNRRTGTAPAGGRQTSGPQEIGKGMSAAGGSPRNPSPLPSVPRLDSRRWDSGREGIAAGCAAEFQRCLRVTPAHALLSATGQNGSSFSPQSTARREGAPARERVTSCELGTPKRERPDDPVTPAAPQATPQRDKGQPWDPEQGPTQRPGPCGRAGGPGALGGHLDSDGVPPHPRGREARERKWLSARHGRASGGERLFS